MKTYGYYGIDPYALTATDLLKEAQAANKPHAYAVRIFGEDGKQAAETAEALYLPSEGRLGIAWGADATWADVKDVESGIEMWLNDGDAWEAAN